MSALNKVKSRFAALSAREQRAVLFGAALVGVALVWGVLVSPAMSVLKRAESERMTLDADLKNMQKLQQRALALQSLKALGSQEVRGTLQSTSTVLGAGVKWTVTGDQATLTLQKVPADLLAQWLAQSRATFQPIQVRLLKDVSADSAPQDASWSGTVLYQLPP